MAQLTIQALRGFVTVVDEGSFSAAARRLGVTQPAVSAQIRTLEEHFEVPLLERAGGRWKPTAAGEELYRHAAQMTTLDVRMQEGMAGLSRQPAGRLELGASTVPGEFLLPKLLGPFCERFPDVRPSVQIADTGVILEHLLLRRLSLGIIGATPVPDPLETRLFATDELLPIAPANHPLLGKRTITVDELVFQPWVLRERGSGSRRVMGEALARMGLDPEKLPVVLELGSTEAVKRAVKAGIGLSFVSCYALEPQEVPESLGILKVKNLKADRDLFIATDRNREPRPSERALVEYLVSTEVSELLGRLKQRWR